MFLALEPYGGVLLYVRLVDIWYGDGSPRLLDEALGW